MSKTLNERMLEAIEKNIDGKTEICDRIDAANECEAIAVEWANKQPKTIPYQCCPVCNGCGQTIADGYTSNVYQTCKVCNGARIIPQYIIQ